MREILFNRLTKGRPLLAFPLIVLMLLMLYSCGETVNVPSSSNVNSAPTKGNTTSTPSTSFNSQLHKGQINAKKMYEEYYNKQELSVEEFGLLIRSTQENLQIWTTIQQHYQGKKSDEEMEYVNALVDGLTSKTK
ncbi:hypothetical protein B6N25_13760 [Sphingobacteriales bacterium TSM_CSS]|nr:hypothetical protein B6N25_13760 [Sphingobacteriales bacterium TSM_CSS]